MIRQSSTVASLRVGVLQFPGSNCDADCIDALKRHFQIEATPIWHRDNKLPKLDAVILPGGFSFGDYLRSGALAAHSPVMQDVKEFAQKGGAILGICNGFQILVESQILPGVLLHNQSQTFICKTVHLKDCANDSDRDCAKDTAKDGPGSILTMPIAHGEGRFWIDEQGLARLEGDGMIAYRYTSPSGQVDQASNPNGAVGNIAGIFSKNKKVLGMMPHPERATDIVMGGSRDGLIVFRNFFDRI
jgi:phosphoribosylformylglycinamidine synthase subunit PurQ / glutaminase